MNVDEFLAASFAALNADDPVRKHEFIEEWVPQVCNEINALRNKVVLLETRCIDLEGEVAALGG